MTEDDMVRATAARWQAYWRRVQAKSLQGLALMLVVIICGMMMGY